MKLREFITNMNEELEKIYNEQGNIDIKLYEDRISDLYDLTDVSDLYQLKGRKSKYLEFTI